MLLEKENEFGMLNIIYISVKGGGSVKRDNMNL